MFYVRSKGFVPRNERDFSNPPVWGLHVIVAQASGPTGGHAQRAFFFMGARFIRTDLPDSSAGIDVAWRSNTTIALAYAAYTAHEALCCPKGGTMIVRYEWTGTGLEALDPIPPPAVRR